MLMIDKFFIYGEPGHHSSYYRRQKLVNLIEWQYKLEPSNDEGKLSESDRCDKEKLYKYNDDDERYTMCLERCC
jgi:hypothetical protein